MQIRNRNNGGIAEADTALANELIATGTWEAVEGKSPSRPRRRSAAPAPAPEPEAEAED